MLFGFWALHRQNLGLVLLGWVHFSHWKLFSQSDLQSYWPDGKWVNSTRWVLPPSVPSALTLLWPNEHQIMHLIRAQPVLESYEVFWCCWTFPVETARKSFKGYEQRHFYANKGKQKCATYVETLQNEMHAWKRDRFQKKVQGMINIQNEIRTRSERDTNLHHLGPFKGQDREAFSGYTRIVLIEVPYQAAWNTSKTRCMPERRDRHEFR